MNKGVLCDTSFLIRLLDEHDELHKNARGYFKYFLDNKHPVILSAVAIAEFCVVGKLNQLPLKATKQLPFNYNHAQIAGDLASILFDQRKEANIPDRKIIPNDTKLFAQAAAEKNIGFYLTCDSRSKKMYNLFKKKGKVDFQFVDFSQPLSQFTRELDFGDE